jgi:hypothetical protein
MFLERAVAVGPLESNDVAVVVLPMLLIESQGLESRFIAAHEQDRRRLVGKIGATPAGRRSRSASLPPA